MKLHSNETYKLKNTMTRNLHYAGRFRDEFLNGSLIANTNYKDQILDTTWQQAIQKVDSLNTIAALTYYIDYYLEGQLNAMENGILKINDKYSFDLPPINSESDWKELAVTFLNKSEKFASKVEKCTTLFAQPFVEEKYGRYL